MKYLFIGLAVSVGWHIGKLIYALLEEVVFSRLHETEWYAVLCKKKERIPQPIKSEKQKEDLSYKNTTLGFRIV